MYALEMGIYLELVSWEVVCQPQIHWGLHHPRPSKCIRQILWRTRIIAGTHLTTVPVMFCDRTLNQPVGYNQWSV